MSDFWGDTSLCDLGKLSSYLWTFDCCNPKSMKTYKEGLKAQINVRTLNLYTHSITNCVIYVRGAGRERFKRERVLLWELVKMETSISLQVRLFQPSQSNTLSLLLGVDRPSSVNQHQEALYIEIHVKFGFLLYFSLTTYCLLAWQLQHRGMWFHLIIPAAQHLRPEQWNSVSDWLVNS